jgi:hypothetical protein
MDPKSRRLRKYEADTDVVATEPGDPAVDYLSPFGPLIARTRLPAELVALVNAYADGQVAPEKGSEFLLPKEVVFGGGGKSLAACVSQLVQRYVQKMDGVPSGAVEFEAFWVVSQYAGTPSPVHFHSGDISGVLYLKVPELEDEPAELEKTYISGRQAGWINFIAGGKQRFAKTLISFRPEPGEFYIFPGWLLHGAEPFRGRGERRSMAFNAFVKDAR